MTRVDTSLSIYREHPAARIDMDAQELRRCRTLLRRLHFLESQSRDRGSSNSESAMWVGWEMDSLEWALLELGFLAEVVPNERKRKA